MPRRSFLVLWLIILPFAFIAALGWYSVPLCIVVGYELLGYEASFLSQTNQQQSDSGSFTVAVLDISQTQDLILQEVGAEIENPFTSR